MRGTKPKPTRQRLLEGNPGKRPRNTAEPQLASPSQADFDVPPAALATTPVAAAEWGRLAPLLRRARAVTEGDRTALVALCLEWARYLEAMSKVAQSGMVLQTPSGYPMANPYLAIATKALASCLKLWPELGLTPSSRTRVKTDGPAPNDPWAEFDEPIAATDAERRH
jgi:P27 family predicted phage terminase small subunit